VRFTWNTQIAGEHYSSQPAQSFHVKRVKDAGCRMQGAGKGISLQTLPPASRIPNPFVRDLGVRYSSGLITKPLSSFG
jgi:hypothetical protein